MQRMAILVTVTALAIIAAASSTLADPGAERPGAMPPGASATEAAGRTQEATPEDVDEVAPLPQRRSRLPGLVESRDATTHAHSARRIVAATNP